MTTVLFAFSCVAATAQTPIAWWKFDEAGGGTAFATLGGVNGTMSGGASFVGGISGNAVSLAQASGGLVNFGNNYGLVGTSYTISFWLNALNTSPSQIILGKHRATITTGYHVGMNFNVGFGAANKVWAYQSSGAGNQPISTTSVNDGSWHHVVTAYNMGTGLHSIYVDGAPAEDTRAAAAMLATTGDFLVGGYNNAGGTPTAAFTGLVDDLQLYDSRLSDADITFLFNNPGQPVVPEPAGIVTLSIGVLAALRLTRRRG